MITQLFRNNEELNPSYIFKSQKISKSKSIEVRTIQKLRERYE